ncbi:DUF5348 domain-containing protein [Paenibacillus gyeongsangnamensis]|uniref:DUF5348 domain-containing protein n=1 Tax=Paenibacillus gyeongsangnamensis TaxID=3388067 RepID=UPI003907F14F
MMQTMKFHKETRRWRLYEGTRLLYPLHCGDPILIEVDDAFCRVSLELDTEWYVKLGETKFWLHRKTVYNVRSLF